MNTKLHFKRFKNINAQRVQKPTTNQNIPKENLIKDSQPQVKDQIITKSPQKKPTSFRQLSGSRDKHKLFSGKKNPLQTKLTSFKSNQKQSPSDQPSLPSQQFQNPSDKKSNIFKKLITSRIPSCILNFDDNSKYLLHNISRDQNGQFDVFKHVNFGQENFDHSNLGYCYQQNQDQKGQTKGLKFKGFPHKKVNVNHAQPNKQKPQTTTLFTEARIIAQKGGMSKIKQKVKGYSQTTEPISKNISYYKQPSQPLTSRNNILPNYQHQYKHQYLIQTLNEADQVIRSRQGLMTFDMSPTLC